MPRRSHNAIHLCDFSSGLDELKRSQQRDWATVLKHLHEHKRFSVFEATANQVIATTMDALTKGEYIEIDTSPGFPWSNVKLTSKGLQLAGVQAEP